MSSGHKYSWIVRMVEDWDVINNLSSLVQVNADSLEMKDGCLIFTLQGYTSFIVNHTNWVSVSIMSQVTGYESGFEEIKEKKHESL